MMTPQWHATEVEEVVARFHSNLETGLSWPAAKRLKPAAPVSDQSKLALALYTLLNQLRGFVVIILLVTALAFFALGHHDDAVGIGISVIFAVVLGFIIDFRAENALAALKALNAPTARVLREGQEHEIPAGELCPGDIAILTAGHRVPGDGRLVEVRGLCVDESVLTGESAAVEKSVAAVGAGQPIAERSDMLFTGTTVVQGYGRMLVTAVGADSELGRLGVLMQQQEKKASPLEQSADQLGRQLALLVLALSVAIFVLGMLRGQPFWIMLETAFILAVAAIPEGLPAVTTVALAGGVHRMVRARCIVRKLAAVETLGAVTVFCTDKTGTLTENRMTVVKLVLPNREFAIGGTGYDPDGAITRDGTVTVVEKDSLLRSPLLIAALCNNAVLEQHADANHEDPGAAANDTGEWHIHGAPTEGALLALAMKGGIDPVALQRRYRRLEEIPFSSARKMMTVVVEAEDGGRWAYVKGSPLALLTDCVSKETATGVEPLSDADVNAISERIEELGATGHRVLGFAYRRIDPDEAADLVTRGMTWAGMAALIDPPRPEAPQVIRTLRQAGVQTVMLTGDHKATALAIAHGLGLGDGTLRCMEAAELADVIARSAWDEVADVSVFARISPEDKLNIIKAFQARGEVVAMTGDGANDAPALKAADIGIAMGAGSVDVAKEAADMVVTDGNYASMAAAVAEGRRIYGNIQKAVRFLMLCSLAQILLLLEAVIAGVALPLSPLQLLWLNLVIHIFPAVGLAVITSDPEAMQRPPRARSERLLSWRELRGLSVEGLLVSILAFAVYIKTQEAGLAYARTLAMATLAISLLMQIFPHATAKLPFVRARQVWEAAPWLGFFCGLTVLLLCIYQPTMSRLLHMVALSPADWTVPLLTGIACLLLMEGLKAGRRLLGANGTSR